MFLTSPSSTHFISGRKAFIFLSFLDCDCRTHSAGWGDRRCLLCYAPNKNLKINCKLVAMLVFCPHGCGLMHSLDASCLLCPVFNSKGFCISRVCHPVIIVYILNKYYHHVSFMQNFMDFCCFDLMQKFPLFWSKEGKIKKIHCISLAMFILFSRQIYWQTTHNTKHSSKHKK